MFHVCNESSSDLTCLLTLQLQDLKAIERVAVQNSVAIRILLKSMVQDSSLQDINVSWDFPHHACYPVIAVKHAASPASL